MPAKFYYALSIILGVTGFVLLANGFINMVDRMRDERVCHNKTIHVKHSDNSYFKDTGEACVIIKEFK